MKKIKFLSIRAFVIVFISLLPLSSCQKNEILPLPKNPVVSQMASADTVSVVTEASIPGWTKLGGQFAWGFTINYVRNHIMDNHSYWTHPLGKSFFKKATDLLNDRPVTIGYNLIDFLDEVYYCVRNDQNDVGGSSARITGCSMYYEPAGRVPNGAGGWVNIRRAIIRVTFNSVIGWLGNTGSSTRAMKFVVEENAAGNFNTVITAYPD